MTDLEGTAQDAPAAAGPAAHPALGSGAPRRRRRWAAVLLVAVVVAGLAAGLVVWAPWTPPPVLRPAGLVAGPSTANSITFHWSRPPTGPLPDKYLVLGGGTVAGSAEGTATSYRQVGLTPATSYQYRVVAVRGGKRSPASALLTVRTLTPPISQARLQGSWIVHIKAIGAAPPGPRNGYMSWHLSPVCAVGACDVMLHGKNGPFPFQVKLARRGTGYAGQAMTHFGCGSPGSSIPYPVTLTIKIHATKATGENQAWAATSFAGTIVMAFRYASTAAFYCPAATVKGVLAGTPA